MSEIDQIKDLLFGHEKKALDALTRRLDTPESRTADVSDVLPQSVLRSHARDAALADAMQAPVTESIRLAVRRNPRAIADSLFPVIGPAIRKAIAEALKGLVQSVNLTLETRLSPTVRYKAWRAGVPLSVFILRRSLVYHVEQAFLIHRETGLLIRHASGVESGADRDAVSAMFTAIQDFVKQSFTSDGSGALEAADMGEYTLWAVHGPSAMLACLIHGTPPRELRVALHEILERIHLTHSELLLDFEGDTDSAAPLQPDLEECLQMEHKEPAGKASAALPGLALWLLIAVAAAGLIYWGASWFKKSGEVRRVHDSFAAAPGIIPLEVIERDGVVAVRGMMDPLASIPAVEGIPAGRLRPVMVPFQSLEPVIVERRVRAALAPPESVELRIDETTLIVTGPANAAFRQRVQTLAPVLAGVDAVEFRQALASDAEILQAVQAAVGQPQAVQMGVAGGILTVSGAAPLAWINALPVELAGVDGLVDMQLSGLEPAERLRLRELAGAIAGTSIAFGVDAEVESGQRGSLDALTRQLLEFVETARAAGLRPEVTLRGFTDSTGAALLNQQLRRERALAVRSVLEAQGLAGRYIRVSSGEPAPASVGADAAWRKVTLAASALDDNGVNWAR